MYSNITLSIAFFFLLGFFFQALLNECLYKKFSKKPLEQFGSLFFYRHLHVLFFKEKKMNALHIASNCTKNTLLFLYMSSVVFFLSQIELFPIHLYANFFKLFFYVTFFFLMSLFFGNFLPKIWVSSNYKIPFPLISPLVSLFMTINFPLSYALAQFSYMANKVLSRKKKKKPTEEIKEKIVDIIQETITSAKLDPNEKRLIESVVTFKDRVVREVMVPRVDLFCLPAETSIEEAAILSIEKGYSRIPVYSNNIDNIIGVLMYKDILSLHVNSRKNTSLDKPVESILKPVLYTPETKKISNLLQEFRNKQMHLAIVVDEYGGTEGIVTIEDILEEIVGEIADEYDKEEKLFTLLPHGGWIIDARMSILDIEEKLGLKIPQDGEYDTIGGYVFHRAGSIPSKGLLIQHNDFELEILSSDDRSIKKIRVIPLTPNKESLKKRSEET